MTLGVPEIVNLIPHRSTMLLIDRVVELVPGERVVATKAVSFGEAWYRGEQALVVDCLAYPHAILLESFNQACAVLVMATWQGDGTDVLDAGVPMLGTYTDVRFGRPVQPGFVLEHRVRVVRLLETSMILAGESLVDGEVALTAGHGIVIRRPAGVLLDVER